MAPPSLTALPLEMLTMIASHLSTPDLGALRLSCRTIEQLLFDNFAKEFFSKKQFMLSYPSLQALVNISKHSGLCKYLRHVIISTETYCLTDLHNLMPDTDFFRCYVRGYHEQCQLTTTGIDCDMLSEAFGNLYNLETLELRDYISQHRRPRDGKAQWKSYGWRSIFEQTGLELSPAKTIVASQISPAGIFQKLVLSLGKSGRSVSTFQTLLRGDASPLPDSAFMIGNGILPTVGPVLRDIKTLLLTVKSLDPEYAQGNLQHFLGHMKDLKHLRLNFHTSGRPDKNEDFFRWLAMKPHPTIPSMPSPPHPSFLHLSQLDLGYVNIGLNILLDVVQHFSPTLTKLSLWRVNALGPPGVSVQPPYDHSMDLWSAFFDGMAAISGLNLRSLVLGDLARRDRPGHYSQARTKIDFKPVGASDGFGDLDSNRDEPMDDDETIIYQSRIELTGPDTMLQLKKLSERVHVQWPRPPSPASSDSEEENGEIEDNVDYLTISSDEDDA